jgi:hypothetical protein
VPNWDSPNISAKLAKEKGKHNKHHSLKLPSKVVTLNSPSQMTIELLLKKIWQNASKSPLSFTFITDWSVF